MWIGGHIYLIYLWQLPLLRQVVWLQPVARSAGLYVLGLVPSPAAPSAPDGHDAAAAFTGTRTAGGGWVGDDAGDIGGVLGLHIAHFVVLHVMYAVAGAHARLVRHPLYKRLAHEAGTAAAAVAADSPEPDASAAEGVTGRGGGGGLWSGGSGIFSPEHLSGVRQPLLGARGTAGSLGAINAPPASFDGGVATAVGAAEAAAAESGALVPPQAYTPERADVPVASTQPAAAWVLEAGWGGRGTASARAPLAAATATDWAPIAAFISEERLLEQRGGGAPAVLEVAAGPVGPVPASGADPQEPGGALSMPLSR